MIKGDVSYLGMLLSLYLVKVCFNSTMDTIQTACEQVSMRNVNQFQFHDGYNSNPFVNISIYKHFHYIKKQKSL
ncbi:hypothetical protein DL897_07805 [Thermoflavimicrobium daqui]|uniref:Uncharacterized protein n=1 Tax=Thermoflavimicrobium daqui TaxID=2137476 RepID=A0A364K6X8_9BACL|nr:hypothetical protein DL897_07805 [Thermoflavimicrobium daqui]